MHPRVEKMESGDRNEVPTIVLLMLRAEGLDARAMILGPARRRRTVLPRGRRPRTKSGGDGNRNTGDPRPLCWPAHDQGYRQ